jgi:hypothetical protein
MPISMATAVFELGTERFSANPVYAVHSLLSLYFVACCEGSSRPCGATRNMRFWRGLPGRWMLSNTIRFGQFSHWDNPVGKCAQTNSWLHRTWAIELLLSLLIGNLINLHITWKVCPPWHPSAIQASPPSQITVCVHPNLQIKIPSEHSQTPYCSVSLRFGDTCHLRLWGERNRFWHLNYVRVKRHRWIDSLTAH